MFQGQKWSNFHSLGSITQAWRPQKVACHQMLIGGLAVTGRFKTLHRKMLSNHQVFNAYLDSFGIVFLESRYKSLLERLCISQHAILSRIFQIR